MQPSAVTECLDSSFNGAFCHRGFARLHRFGLSKPGRLCRDGHIVVSGFEPNLWHIPVEDTDQLRRTLSSAPRNRFVVTQHLRGSEIEPREFVNVFARANAPERS